MGQLASSYILKIFSFHTILRIAKLLLEYETVFPASSRMTQYYGEPFTLSTSESVHLTDMTAASTALAGAP